MNKILQNATLQQQKTSEPNTQGSCKKLIKKINKATAQNPKGQ